MILGIGIDLVEVDRVRGLLDRFGERFLKRVFGPDEIKFCLAKRDTPICLAGRIAAKESAIKALSLKRPIGFRDVEVLSTKYGPPGLKFKGRAEVQANSMGMRKAYLSISHEKSLASAVVILEK